jgi:putative transposase
MCFVANKRAYKSNKNIVYSCKYHVVWTPKYRRKVLVRGVDVRLKEIVYEVADELQCEIIALEVMCDHVHMLCEVDPQLGIHRFVKRVKGKSSRMLRQEFDELRSRLPTLWTNSYFVATVAGAPLAIIQQYIENQKNV